jgi:hypothetical protein
VNDDKPLTDAERAEVAQITPVEPGNHSAYYDAMRDADLALDGALTAVRAEQDAGRITPAQAATERVGLLEAHITLCERLRAELLGGS